MLGWIIAGSAIGGVQAANPAASVDRSGEARLRSMLQQIVDRKKYACYISKSTREAGRLDFYPDGEVEVWRDGYKYRIEFNDMWGSFCSIVTDGSKTLEDPGFDAVVVRKTPARLSQLSSALEPNGMIGSPWFYLAEGPTLLDKIDKDKSIAMGKTDNSVVWNTTLFGDLTLTLEHSDKDLQIWVIDFNRLAWQKEMFEAFPDWYNPPDAAACWRHRVIVRSGPFPSRAFDLKPPKGRQVRDETKVAKKPPRT